MPTEAPPVAPAPDDKPSLGRRIVMFPLVRIVIAFVWVMAFPSAFAEIFAGFGGAFGVARAVIAALAGLGLYYWYVRVVERRAPDEIALRPSVAETAIGFGWGLALMGVIVGILALLGCYHIIGIYGRAALWDIVALAILSGVLEELLFRTILFRILEEGVGTVAALILSSLLFGFVHAFNPNATLASSLCIFVGAGPLLAAVYLWRRRLWAPIGVHAGWNFLQAALGAPVSGVNLPGVVTARVSGPVWLTGGTFGPEAGLVACVCALLAFVYFLFLAVKREPLHAPAWMPRIPTA